MDATERIQAASNFLLQSPPGEINDVLNDIRTIIADDELLQDGIKAALKEYNIEQFTVVDVPEANHQSIISEAARVEAEGLDEERFLDPRSKISFLFDHLSLEASDPKPIEPDARHEEFRSALELASLNYLKAHFKDGVTAIFSPKEGAEHFVVQVVANKYNPTNFWSGRWRSEYTIDLNKKQVAGKVLVNVHYYEQGNVQLATKHTVSFDLPVAVASAPTSAASTKIFALLEEEEGKLQVSFNETYHEMGEKTFKGLRRALPLTRQKLDWDKVMGYKLGAELSGTKSPQPASVS
ncbi:F-actin capping protein, alpha subunit [Crepidotus variabilis]|uniref:F-actin-capping protein subunit alpha n=1 Tax=Crepidotus variabilis TaxID=179855 RepID=A0A9P6EDS6_9AGAR|nr:F-actin capping protein, alpha subunit [Crepidotus variabilis]